jgi:hypothetical protein
LRLFPPEIEVAPDEGFAPQKDIFGRKTFGDQLTRIVSTLESPSVLLLDAPWGTGKTTFVKMWRGELKKIGIPSIYFDAFANDYQQDAFLAIASQIIAAATNLASTEETALDKFRTHALKAAKILGRATLHIGVRAATAGLVEYQALEKTGEDIVNSLGDEAKTLIDDILKERLEHHNSDQIVFDQFKRSVSELAIALAGGVNSTENARLTVSDSRSPTQPLIFIVDELDRCRPSFALELLEKIKHVFTTTNVTFVIVSSLSQLKSAVCFSYGDIDAQTYLEKFYHLRILFPVGSIGKPNLLAATYLRYLGCHQDIVTIIDEFARVNPLSLRTLERVAAYAKLIQASLPKNGLFLTPIVSILCVIRVVRQDLYDNIRSSNVTFEQIADFICFSRWRGIYGADERTSTSIYVERWWAFALGALTDQEALRGLQNVLVGYSVEPTRLLPLYCELADGFSLPSASQ